jgi:hypothetical protein
MPPIFRPFVALLALTAVAPSVAAQVLQPPSRPSRGLFGGGQPPDPNHTHQELELSGDVLGGFDDNLSTPGSNDMFGEHPAGYIGFGDASLRYFMGREARSMTVTGRGYLNSYSDVGLGPSYGADQTFLAHTTLGSRTTVRVGEGLHYVPFFSLGLFSPLTETAGASDPDRNPTNAVSVTRSWASDLSASITQAWTRRLHTDASYTFNKQTFVEGVGFDSTTNAVTLSADQSLGRTTSIRGSYRRSVSTFVETNNVTRPLNNDSIEGGFNYQRNVTRTRRVAFSAGLGALHVDSYDQGRLGPYQYWAPSGYGSARIDLTRSWSLSGDYRRAVAVLEGLTPQAFVTDSAMVRAGGFLNRRLEAVLSGDFATGQAGQSQGAVQIGEYSGYTGTAQLRVLLRRGWSTVVSYNYYRYNLSAEAVQFLGVSPHLNRNAVRIGFTWNALLFGTRVDTPARTPGGRD